MTYQNPRERSVILQAFHTHASGDQSYTDNPDETDGWCVYIRTETPDDPQQPFSIDDVGDFETRPEAEDAATLAAIRCNLGRFGWREE